MNKVPFLDYYLFADDLENINKISNKIISTINTYSFLFAEKDKEFKEVLQNSDILLPDGEGIVWATKFLFGIEIKKIAGYDLFIHLMEALQEQKGGCFFFGSSEKTLEKIKNKTAYEYPSVNVNYLSPPFKAEFSGDENAEFVSYINTLKPSVLFVGMTAPKQEKWVYKNREKLNVPIIASIGAVFDFYVGNVKRAPKIFIQLKIEWLYRILQQPMHMLKRHSKMPIFHFIIIIIIKKFQKAKNSYLG